MGAGRFVCVALPFGLTLASLICILIVMLAGITNKDLDMFEIRTQNLSISSSSLENLVDLTKRDDSLSALTVAALSPNPSTDITAADLALADSYKVSLWSYCATTGGKSNCTSPEFNWAATKLNVSTIESTASALTGMTLKLPSELRSALKTFRVVSRWTQVVYIIAAITCGLELFLGLFGFCSRVGSCFTYIVSGLSTAAIIIASIMATVSSSVVIAAVRSTAKSYGVKGSINTSFLATTWLAVVFSVGAGFFWMFSTCCCASSDRSSSSKRKSSDQEKLMPTGAYQRVADNTHYNNGFSGQQHGIYNQQPTTEYGVPMQNVKPVARGGNGAYEPYSHTAI
ncbi:hypothetical protein LZ554_004205 [Drepanopeziza brunnea f. sp. 'monogermtubi']|nr:hypothetical protein LZ554_004205 [Drepanopeziza brunnea f. sp. 'monogermtubi']